MSFSFIEPNTASVNSPGQVSDVQLDRRWAAELTWGVGHRVAASCAAGEHELHVLARVVAKLLVGRQLQSNQRHVGRRALQAQHPRGHLQHCELARAGNASRLDHAVGLRRGATGQDRTSRFFRAAQGFLLVCAVHHPTFEQFALARSAGAVPTAIGQTDTLAYRCVQQGLAVQHIETAARRQEGELEGHGSGVGAGDRAARKLV
jgi:hypothetical protein